MHPPSGSSREPVCVWARECAHALCAQTGGLLRAVGGTDQPCLPSHWQALGAHVERLDLNHVLLATAA